MWTVSGLRPVLRNQIIFKQTYLTRDAFIFPCSLILNMSTSSSATTHRLQESRSLIEKICSIESVPGVSLGVLHHGEVIYTDNLGFRDREKASPTEPDTLYGIGSLTKSFISAAIGKLVEIGKLEWKTPVRELLPKFSHQDSLFAEKVTIADLLSHHSGLAGGVPLNLAFQGDGEMLLSADSLYQIVHYIPHVVPIGERWMYCVWGYSLAGCIIEEVTQQPLHQYLQRELFDPLGMNHTTLRPSKHDMNVAQPYASLADGNAFHLERRQPFAETLFEASGGIYSTASDLLIWSKAILDATQEAGPSDTAVLKQISEILRPQIEVDPLSLPGQSYGFGWLQAKLPTVVGITGDNPDLWKISDLPILGSRSTPQEIIYHQGTTVGYFSFLALFPETKSAVVVLTNAIAMSDVAEWIARILIEALFDFPDRTDYARLSEEGKTIRIQQFEKMHADLAEERAPGTRPLPADAYVGQYLDETYNFTLDIALDPDRTDELVLAFQSRASQRYKLRHLHDNVFEWAPTHDESKRRGRYTVADPSYFKLTFEVDSEGQPSKIGWDLDESSAPGGVVFSRLSRPNV